MEIPDNKFNYNSPDYRYGYNGKEKDSELKGEGNSYDFGERMYDPRIARFLSIDPLTTKFPLFSPFLFAGNSPIFAIDKNGEYIYIVTKPDPLGKPVIRKATAEDLKDVPGFQGLYKTKSGQKLIDKYLNSESKDLYLTVKKIKNAKSGGDTHGQTLDPDLTKPLTNKDGEFDILSTIETERQKGTGVPSGLFELNKSFGNFNGVPLREDAKENAFIVVDPQSERTEAQKVSTAGHEVLHQDEFEKGNKGDHHETNSFKKGLEKIDNEYKEVEKKEKGPK